MADAIKVGITGAAGRMGRTLVELTVAHPSFFRRFGFRWMELYGHSPSNCHPAAVDDYGTREGTVEIDEILSAVNLSAESLKSNVIKIAEKCGLSFDDEQIAELVKS